jgi:hypothetical protein
MPYPQTYRIVFFFLIASAVAAVSFAAETDTRNAAVMTITTEKAKEHVGVLADDTFEGRAAGSRGNRAAGIYIIERLKRFGVAGGGAKGGYYQSFATYNNILGQVEGSDPELKKQTVVIGAHYDHVGYGSPNNSYGPLGRIHNGADDNASGVAGLLAVAEALNQLPTKPRRSILFAFWDGEEGGLIGSKHWVEHPTIPLSQIPIVVNADMIGRLRNNNLLVYGTRTCRDLRWLVSQQNDVSNLVLDFNWDIKSDSDQYSFCTRDIPYLMMHTGQHGDYHRPSDDADKINNDGLRRITQLTFKVLVALCDAPRLDGFRHQARRESHIDQNALAQPLAPLPGRLGLAWDEKAAAQGAIIVASVTPDRAAAKGGLRSGDRLLKFAGREVGNAREFRASVLAAQSPTSVVIQRPGENAPRELSLVLPGQPVRLGVSWRADDAEPGAMIVNRVIPGSPADLAGIRLNDRIHRVGDKQFATTQEFQQAVAEVDGALVLEVESEGRVKTIEVPQLETAAADQPSETSRKAE